MRRAALATAAALAFAGAARADTYPLPSPLQPLSPSPPLGAYVPQETEAGAVVHPVPTTERVDVSVDGRGRPFAVRVLQRLVVLRKGDYVFAIPAPVARVTAARGSESAPGQRRGMILWSGFGAGRKVLAADVELHAREAAPALPLRIAVSADGVTIANATVARATTFSAETPAAPLARYLGTVRRAAARGPFVPFGTVRATRARPAFVRVEAPLRVTGTVAFGGATRRVAATLGDGRPLRLALRGRTRGGVRVHLTATPVPPLRTLAPPPRATGRELLARATGGLLRLARVRQYDAFLATPDPRGDARTTYVYRTATRPRAPAIVIHERTRTYPLLTAILVALAAAAALSVWARS